MIMKMGTLETLHFVFIYNRRLFKDDSHLIFHKKKEKEISNVKINLTFISKHLLKIP